MSGSSPQIKIAFTGDLALAGDFVARTRPAGEGPLYNFAPLMPDLQGLDLLVVNLEGPLGSQGTPRSRTAALLHNELEVLQWFKQFPTVVCNLANNHMLDYGPEALDRTQKILLENGVAFLGAGANRAEANAELILDVKGQKFGFLSGTTDEKHVGSTLATSTSPGCATIGEPNEFCARVSNLAARTDNVIVILHWGFEFFQYPHPDQVSLCRALAAAGAALIINHHSHVAQGIETVGNSLIAYSLGNLLLPPFRLANGRSTYRKPLTRKFMVLRTELIAKQIRNWNVLGGNWSKTFQLCPYNGHQKQEFDALTEKLSRPLRDKDYHGFWGEYEIKRRVELKRESLSDAFAKIPQTDWITAIGNINSTDFTRIVRRFRSILRTPGDAVGGTGQ